MERELSASEPIGRGVIAILVTGLFLGLAFNQLGHMSKRGLPWIAEEKELASLETVLGGSTAAQPEKPKQSPQVDLNDPLAGAVIPQEGEGLPEIPDLDRPFKVEAGLVKKFFDAKGALIIDAREPDDYAEGHIPGSLNLPADSALSDPVKLQSIDAHGKPIIVYCGGGTCEVSMTLAEALIYQAAQRKVLVYTGGWPDWTQKGYPVEKGATK